MNEWWIDYSDPGPEEFSWLWGSMGTILDKINLYNNGISYEDISARFATAALQAPIVLSQGSTYSFTFDANLTQ